MKLQQSIVINETTEEMGTPEGAVRESSVESKSMPGPQRGIAMKRLGAELVSISPSRIREPDGSLTTGVIRLVRVDQCHGRRQV